MDSDFQTNSILHIYANEHLSWQAWSTSSYKQTLSPLKQTAKPRCTNARRPVTYKWRCQKQQGCQNRPRRIVQLVPPRLLNWLGASGESCRIMIRIKREYTSQTSSMHLAGTRENRWLSSGSTLWSSARQTNLVWGGQQHPRHRDAVI